jgi:hypothetical protein
VREGGREEVGEWWAQGRRERGTEDGREKRGER